MSQAQIERTGASRGSLKSYTAGLLLSVVLTLIPFALIMSGVVDRSATLFWIFGAAILQIVVQLHFFLHLDRSSAARWNVLALIFTSLIVTLFVGGTIWIMVHMNYRGM
jgi:cytochrome o ubiquinol oxidase operon protein cyoD